MNPGSGPDVGELLQAAHNGNYRAFSDLDMEDENLATLLSTEMTNTANANLQRETNQFNKELHEMDNAFNADQADLARKFQREMRDEDREWNKPINQKLRMMEAGLNPMSLTGLSSQPVQSSTPSAVPASSASPIAAISPTMQSAHLTPYASRGTDIAAALSNVANASNGFADTMVKLRNVRNQESAIRSQNLLNLAKTIESQQTTSNLKQTHDVLVPANVENIISEIKRRDKENDKSDADIDLIKSNKRLNEEKINEIRQGIVQSQAEIDNMRKTLNWRYYDTNQSAYHSWSGMIGRIVEGTSIVKDLQSGVQAITDAIKFFKGDSAKEKAAAAWQFVEDVGSQALKSGDLRLMQTYSYLREAAKVLEVKWYNAKRGLKNAWNGQTNQVNLGGISILNPVHGDTYTGQ